MSHIKININPHDGDMHENYNSIENSPQSLLYNRDSLIRTAEEQAFADKCYSVFLVMCCLVYGVWLMYNLHDFQR
jgi:hypothetical protein